MTFKDIMNKLFRRMGKWIFWVLPIASIVLLVFVIYPMYKDADEVGKEVGDTTGKLVGKAIGTYKGVTEGVEVGYEEGKKQGLSNEDTITEIKNTMESVGRLEVLKAQVKIDKCQKVGEKYAVLYVNDCNAVYTVDLNETEVVQTGDTIVIRVPEPEMMAYKGNPEKKAEYKAVFSFGNAEDGKIAYENSEIKTNEEVKDKMSNYTELMNQAKKAAKAQVKDLADLFNLDGATIDVEFLK